MLLDPGWSSLLWQIPELQVGAAVLPKVLLPAGKAPLAELLSHFNRFIFLPSPALLREGKLALSVS